METDVTPRSARFEAEVERLAGAARGIVGIGIHHVQSGWTYSLNPECLFHMTSAYKLPIAVCLLRRVDEGSVELDQTIDIPRSAMAPGSGIIGPRFPAGGISLSISNLLDLALTGSDNTASDVILDLAGGPKRVTELLRRAGIEGMRIDRTAKQVLSDLAGIRESPSTEEWTLERFYSLRDSVSDENRVAALERYFKDDRDTTTSIDMVTFLRLLVGEELLKPGTTSHMLSLMENCSSGPKRLKGKLPKDVVVAHKTGTLTQKTITDVGILALPGGGQLVVAVFIKSPKISDSDCEDVIANIARAAYDFARFCL